VRWLGNAMTCKYVFWRRGGGYGAAKGRAVLGSKGVDSTPSSVPDRRPSMTCSTSLAWGRGEGGGGWGGGCWGERGGGCCC
jgi:hypothetical protein